MEKQQSYIGTIVKLIHPGHDGFIQYQGDKLIYFYDSYKHFFQRKTGTWQIGDRVNFYIGTNKCGTDIALIFSYIGNPITEELMQKAQQKNQIVLKGVLKAYDGNLFFLEPRLKLMFGVRYLTLSDVNLMEDKEYEAILNVNESPREVVLKEWIKVREQLKQTRINSKIISVTLIKVRPEYLNFLIPGTSFYGKLERFDRTIEYKVGESIDVCSIKEVHGLCFRLASNHKNKKFLQFLPVREKTYQAVVLACEEQYYRIDIIDESFGGVIPKVLFGKKQIFDVGEIINVIFRKRTRDLRYSFLTTQQQAIIDENKERRKQVQANRHNDIDCPCAKEIE